MRSIVTKTFILERTTAHGPTIPLCSIDASTLADALAELGMKLVKEGTREQVVEFIDQERRTTLLERIRQEHPFPADVTASGKFTLTTLPWLIAYPKNQCHHIDPFSTGC
jgi:hypothetical protein